jgi:hypothetical protein
MRIQTRRPIESAGVDEDFIGVGAAHQLLQCLAQRLLEEAALAVGPSTPNCSATTSG